MPIKINSILKLNDLKKCCIKFNLQLQQQHSFKTSASQLSIGGKTSSTTLILSPAEATRILRAHESTVDIESKSAIKYYDINYLGANNPAEDRQTQAKFLHSDVYLFGVFDGHGGEFEKIILVDSLVYLIEIFKYTFIQWF